MGRTEVMSFRDDVEPTMLLLFTEADRRVRRYRPKTRSQYEVDDDGWVTCVELAAPVNVIRDRLDVLGISPAAVAEVLKASVAQKLEFAQRWLDEKYEENSRDYERHVTTEIDLLRRLDFDTWCTRVRGLDRRRKNVDDSWHAGSLRWLLDLWAHVDPRFVVRAVIEALPNAREIMMDLTGLVEGGWLPADLSPRDAALEHFTWVAANASPAIILTEGSTDARIISAAIKVLRPHLEGFLRVAEFSEGREGGAGSLANAVRSFAAAGVANRVVALFDNDTGAAEAISTLDMKSLPANLLVLTLPRLESAGSYPTIGPTGMSSMDVNGLACSIELYLGSDVLRGNDGRSQPVQWRGFNQKLQRYQGELIDKRRAQEAFIDKAQAALASPRVRQVQDWTGMELVLTTIIESVSELGRSSR